MDWLSLVEQITTKEKETTETDTSEVSSGDISEELIKPEGELDALEVAVLICVLDSVSLSLNILHSTMPDSKLQGSTSSAKRLHEIVEKTISELEESGTFDYLHATVLEESIKRRSDARVEKDIVDNERKIRQLQLQIRSNDKIRMRDVNKKQEIIASLKDEVQNLIAKTDCKIRYVEKWKAAQQEENLAKCEKQEMQLKSELESLSDKYRNEIAVNDKICSFLNEQIMKLEKEFDSWKDRYHSEMTHRTEKIAKLQERSREQQFRLQELKQLFNERQQEMQDYLIFKEEKKAEEEYERFKNESATKIQAWWRGTMVRRGLGSYKRRKKVTKEKKKKGK